MYLVLLMGLLEDYFVPLHHFYLTPDSFDQKVRAGLRRGSAFFKCNAARHGTWDRLDGTPWEMTEPSAAPGTAT